MTMNILVTGGCGYIGTKLTMKLIERGHTVRILDLEPPSEELETYDYIQGDIRDIEVLKEAIKGIDTVVHLAAVVPRLAGGETHPLESQMDDINHIGTCRLAYFARERGVSRFVFASTCSTYGAGELVDEKGPQVASIPYAVSKIGAEKCLLPLVRDDFDLVVLRFATVFGPASKGRMGWHTVFNTFVHDAMFSKRLEIFNPDAYRPFVNVNDVVKGIILAVEHSVGSDHTRVFNVGGTNCTKGELATMIKEVLPDTVVTMDDGKNKGYSVSFDKIAELDFGIETSAKEGIEQYARVFRPELFSRAPDGNIHRREWILTKAGQDGSICDVGCADGSVWIGVKTPVVTVDRREVCEGGYRPTVSAFAENLPFNNNNFGVVVLGDILEHVLDVQRVLREALRVARTKLVITVPNEWEWEPELTPFQNPAHIRHFTELSLKNELDNLCKPNTIEKVNYKGWSHWCAEVFK